jgi:hypothetical protein
MEQNFRQMMRTSAEEIAMLQDESQSLRDNVAHLTTTNAQCVDVMPCAGTKTNTTRCSMQEKLTRPGNHWALSHSKPPV